MPQKAIVFYTMIKFNKKKANIVFATCMAIFSLASAFAGTFAWFASNTDVGASGMQVTTGIRGKFSKISYHQMTTASADEYHFNKTPTAYMTYDWSTMSLSSPKDGNGQTIASFDLVMGAYNPLDQTKPVLVLIELDKEYDTSAEGNVLVKGVTETTGFLGAKNIDRQPEYTLGEDLVLKVTGGHDYYPLSSVVTFRSISFSEDDFSTWSGNSTYDITFSNTSPSYDRDFTVVDNLNDTSSFESNITIYNSDGNTAVEYIAIVVNYKPIAIEYIYSTYLGDPLLGGTYEDTLYFTCDWVWEIVC